MRGYSTQEVARLLDLPVQRIRSYARAGFVTPGRDEHNSYNFTFQDLVLLRTAAELERAHVPARRITTALSHLKENLPDGRSLTELRIHAAGDEVVVRESSEPPWNPQSGQFHFEFDIGSLVARIEPLEQSQPTQRTAAEWFELGLELEASSAPEARAAYRSALALDDGMLDARVNLGRLLHEAGELEGAEAEYQRVLSHGEHALAAYNLGVVLEDAGRVSDAIKAYARAIAADPELAEAHFNLARLYERRGDRRAAIRYFNGYRELVRLRDE
jgi:tetratricopeptide (TPR) repeat protein